MAPKKKDEGQPTKPLLGRFKSHLKMGIVGLPNVGKSTTFNLLTKLSIPAENFPFCTIEPNNARVMVPDERFEWLCQLYKPKNSVSAFLDVVDIAGLVKGAAEGQGLGNAFLSHIAAVDGIFHVCRTFEDPDITHVEDRVDPVDDLDIIHGELRAKDLEKVLNTIADIEKQIPRGLKKEAKEELELCYRIRDTLQAGTDIRHGEWNAKDIDYLNTQQFISSKPIVYIVNMSEKDFVRKKNKWLPKIAEWVKNHGADPVIPYSAAYEQKVFDMEQEEKENYFKETGTVSQLNKIITTGFRAIHLIYFFTAGEDEVKCWQIREGTKAPQAAGAIHTDFEKGFICAEVMKYDELKELGNESAVKAAGKYRQEGKNYTVQDGDVIYFKFNLGRGK
eukprot:TRINITY_DN6087_c0_g3_i4.p2 TRINITY_DN6087_c0_g3~~TRINITY_DN6087_c0_g3_i4.p2  ORF type:complete len:391 (-),score=66.24 TRINITY_DN6087_c0_g3_i4:232-1404(-)